MATLQALTSLDARHLSRVLATSEPGSTELVASEWLAVVQLLTTRLTDECRVLSADDWMIASVALDHALANAKALGAIDQGECVIRRLNLSAALLQQVLPNSDATILNPTRMFDLFTEALPVSVEEARNLSLDWRTLDISVVRHLRLAKNLVSPILAVRRVLSDAGIIGDLDAWEEVFPLLP
jgi:hypothetical protein